jgi:hypothetical protein
VSNRSFAAGPRSLSAEYPVLKVKRSNGESLVELPLMTAAVVQAVDRD